MNKKNMEPDIKQVSFAMFEVTPDGDCPLIRKVKNMNDDEKFYLAMAIDSVMKLMDYDSRYYGVEIKFRNMNTVRHTINFDI